MVDLKQWCKQLEIISDSTFRIDSHVSLYFYPLSLPFLESYTPKGAKTTRLPCLHFCVSIYFFSVYISLYIIFMYVFIVIYTYVGSQFPGPGYSYTLMKL